MCGAAKIEPIKKNIIDACNFIEPEKAPLIGNY